MSKPFLAAVLVSAACAASAAPKTTLPAAVQKEINSDKQICQEMGGTVSPTAKPCPQPISITTAILIMFMTLLWPVAPTRPI
ncbi:hypothetical protein [Kingella potus]|uniref:hypothetical protein n=1 Tax=Kingella potus TaxID=265175 RepID=UPI001FD1F9D1|nr:hypothetical protein [Kingella potus]UOP00119.1 hypothetical protein LVJ84_09150 [Kingella potus]